ncbi:hypothetical protein KSP40_PGU018741 [Platanthera guangdongensis]|uniref:Uncharacterized protein n=1 Tax=Platanthera guangdongensis TaxID=2320717 RepID=A0ABR2MCP6_9ASPA
MHKIAAQICRSGCMSSHILHLFIKGFPTKIYLSGGSWKLKGQIEEVLSQFNFDRLKVLCVGICGDWLLDEIGKYTIAKALNCLPSLNNLSLRDAKLLSDKDLNTIISSAPLFKSLDLSWCKYITSKGIKSLVKKLGPISQEVYMKGCIRADAMSILSALKKLNCLEALCMAHMDTVTDKFVKN